MSEVLQLPDPECLRALAMLAASADGELTAGQSQWLAAHLEVCEECCAASQAFTEVDNELTAWGQRLELQSSPPPARERLAASLPPVRRQRRVFRWSGGLVAASVAALALVIVASRFEPAASTRPAPTRFLEIPYVPPLDPHENATIVSMDIPVAVLVAAGYKIAGDPGSVVQADVLVGEDGRAHAVRVLSSIN